MRKLSGLFLLIGGLLAVLFPVSRVAQSQVCTSRGQIIQYDTLCECSGFYIQTYGCQGLSGPKCDPYAGDIFCGTGGDDCAVGYASDNCGASALSVHQAMVHSSHVSGSQSNAPRIISHKLPTLTETHSCLDNAALKSWLEAKMPQSHVAREFSRSVGST